MKYFTKFELSLWIGSILLITGSYLLFDEGSYMTLIASLIGVTGLIFAAKGNPFGQFLMVIFSLIYGIISYGFRYYGEMMTYLGMSMPMAIFSMISWLRNPYQGGKAEVKVNHLHRPEIIFLTFLTAIVTGIFYFILKYFGTANLFPSTLSVTTSFIAVYLTFRRSPYFGLGYACNDVILIILWGLASLKDPSYLSVLVCFIVFLVNDIYGFISWKRMEQRQNQDILHKNET